MKESTHGEIVPRHPPEIQDRLPFRSGRNWDFSLIALFLAIQLVVLANALLHSGEVQYDGGSHRQYVNTLADGRLPTPKDSREFFSPPLPYAPMAIARALGQEESTAAKLGQLLNVLLSFGLCWYLLRICEVARPGDRTFKLASLGFLGMLPVFYRTFAFPRGEPWVAFFAVAATFLLLRLVVLDDARTRVALQLGLILGLLSLSRQWGVLLYPAIAVSAIVWLYRDPERRRALGRKLFLSAVVCLAVGGWFYLHLHTEFGSIAAFNKKTKPFRLSNHGVSFYTSPCYPEVFTWPLRDACHGHLWPILYTDTWGDYWHYFLVRGTDPDTGELVSGRELFRELRKDPSFPSNRASMAVYLGRVNLTALLPSALALLGFVVGWRSLIRSLQRTPSPTEEVRGLLALLVTTTLLGYLWFVVTHPGATSIKATYVLQIYPFLAILAADSLVRIDRRLPALGRVLKWALVVVALHLAPALVTHYGPHEVSGTGKTAAEERLERGKFNEEIKAERQRLLAEQKRIQEERNALKERLDRSRLVGDIPGGRLEDEKALVKEIQRLNRALTDPDEGIIAQRKALPPPGDLGPLQDAVN